jgi:glycosyltransferase involved in cell wall biosynthesis
MLATAFRARGRYEIAQIEVFSGRSFVWAEAACALLSWLRKPYILALHGGRLPEFARRRPARVRRLLERAHAVVAPSRYLHEQMAPFVRNVMLIPNPLSLSEYPFLQRRKVEPRLIWLRAFHEIYNPSLAARVMALLADDVPHVRLTMVGRDKSDGSLQRTRAIASGSKVSDRIEIPGGVPKTEVPSWLQKADIFINTTNVDNTPVSVMEAMACGLCIVSTNAGGVPYLLEHEHDALLVPTDDAPAMAAAVRRILNEPDLAARLSTNARRKAETFDWSVVLPSWNALFDRIGANGFRTEPELTPPELAQPPIAH